MRSAALALFIAVLVLTQAPSAAASPADGNLRQVIAGAQRLELSAADLQAAAEQSSGTEVGRPATLIGRVSETEATLEYVLGVTAELQRGDLENDIAAMDQRLAELKAEKRRLQALHGLGVPDSELFADIVDTAVGTGREAVAIEAKLTCLPTLDC